MKKLLVALALITSPLAYAEDLITSTVRVQMQCFELSKFPEVLDRYREEPVFSMDIMTHSGDRLVRSQTIFTLNIDKREWTMYRQVNDDTVCVQAAGENFDFLGSK